MSIFKHSYVINVGQKIDFKQEYAAQELHKYIYQLTGEDALITNADETGTSITFILGTPDSNPQIAQMNLSLSSLGDEDYIIKTSGANNAIVTIASRDSQGILYGIYGLLDDHYGVGFYFSGDVMPVTKKPLLPLSINESKRPKQYIRGILPWTNFPQSATIYSLQDWKFVIDQMTRMRMNFLNIHNYNGQHGYNRSHNEVFHNIMLNGTVSRVWNATVRVPHDWGGVAWDVNQFLFGATDLFDDYDFGTDATLHNENMSNIDVFKKGSSQFQFVLDYAHKKGVKVGLGIDINLVPEDYGFPADHPDVAKARAEQLATDYPDLDYLMLYRSEIISDINVFDQAFNIIYPIIKQKAPEIKFAVSGWGVNADTITNLPMDVIVAPISPHGSNDSVVNATVYGEREFWACPWVERDYDDSMYFVPYKMNLGTTISTYQEYSANAKGFMSLTWRLTDGVDAKLSYIAKAPWDDRNKYNSSEAVYGEYAAKCYGAQNADSIISVINQNEAYATNVSECQKQSDFIFSNRNRSTDINKADLQIATVDSAIANTEDIGEKHRLSKLKSRLLSVKYFCLLDQNFYSTQWSNLQNEFYNFIRGFIDRIDDISSLGNVTAMESRFVKGRYLAQEKVLRSAQTIQAPSNVVVKNTSTGAVITWSNEEPNAHGYNVYRNGTKINKTPIIDLTYTDVYNGSAIYTISAISATGEEGTQSVSHPTPCLAGSSDMIVPNVFVISPPTVVIDGQDVDIKVIIDDNSAYEQLSATLYYRAIGSKDWKTVQMERRIKSTFGIRLCAGKIAKNGMEYYVLASDSKNVGVYPKTAPNLPAVFSVVSNESSITITTPETIGESQGCISWKPSKGNVHWYRIYRGITPDFEAGPQSLLTYVYRDTLAFKDSDTGFDGKQLNGTYYYKITAMDINCNESLPSSPIRYTYVKGNVYNFADYSKAYGSAHRVDGIVGYVKNGDCLEFDNIEFTGNNNFSITFSANTTSIGNTIELWLDGKDKVSGGRKLGAVSLPLTSTSNWCFYDLTNLTTGTINGRHNLFFVCKGGNDYLYNLKTFRIGNANIDIQTNEDSFAAGFDRPLLQLFTGEDVNWSVQALDSGSTTLAAIDHNGLLTCYSDGTVRVIAISKNNPNLIGERLITLRHSNYQRR